MISAQHCKCSFCSKCTGGCKEFQKLLQLKPGVAIYRHVPHVSETHGDSSNENLAEGTSDVIIGTREAASTNDIQKQETRLPEDQTHNIFVHNTDNTDFSPADFLPEFDKMKISCLRCRRIVANARNLLQNINVVNKNEIRGVCEICKVKQYQNLGPVPCVVCERMGKKLAISLMRDSIKKRVMQTSEPGHVRRRRYSDVNIEKLIKIRDAYYHDNGLRKPKSGPVLMSTKTSSCLEEAKSTKQEDFETDKLNKQDARLFEGILKKNQYDKSIHRPVYDFSDQIKHVSDYSKDMSKVAQHKILSEAKEIEKDHERLIRDIRDKNITFAIHRDDYKETDGTTGRENFQFDETARKPFATMMYQDYNQKQRKSSNTLTFHIDSQIEEVVDSSLILDTYKYDYHKEKGKIIKDKDELVSKVSEKEDDNKVVMRRGVSEIKSKSEVSYHKKSQKKEFQHILSQREAGPISQTRSLIHVPGDVKDKHTTSKEVFQGGYRTPSKKQSSPASQKSSLLHASQSHKKETTSFQRKEEEDRHEAAKRERAKVQTHSQPPLSSSRVKGILRRRPSQHGDEGKSQGPSKKKVDPLKHRTKAHSDDSIVTSFADIKPGMSRKNLKYFFPRQSKKKSPRPKSSTYLIKETKDKIKQKAAEKQQKVERDFQKQKEREEKKEKAKEEKSSREKKGDKKEIRDKHERKSTDKDEKEKMEENKGKSRKRSTSFEERDEKIVDKKQKDLTSQGVFKGESVKRKDTGGSDAKDKTRERKTTREERSDETKDNKKKDLADRDTFKGETVNRKGKDETDSIDRDKNKTVEKITKVSDTDFQKQKKIDTNIEKTTETPISRELVDKEAKKEESDRKHEKELRPPETETSQKIIAQTEAKTDKGKEIKPEVIKIKISTVDIAGKKPVQKEPETKQPLPKKPTETKAKEEVQLVNKVVKKHDNEKHSIPKPNKKEKNVKPLEHQKSEKLLTKSEEHLRKIKNMTYKIHDETPAYPQDDTILKLIKVQREEKATFTMPKPVQQALPTLPPDLVERKPKVSTLIVIDDRHSDLELDKELLLAKLKHKQLDNEAEIIIGKEIFFKKNVPPEPKVEEQPVALFRSVFDSSMPTKNGKEPLEDIELYKPDLPPAAFRYQLSDRTFIENGWTQLPSVKFLRKMNLYRMRPVHPNFDWFERNKSKGYIQYDTGEKLAEISEDGRGHWYYKNGRLALDYYDSEDLQAQQRFVVYSNGEPDARGRSRPVTILAMFDYSGNGVVFDHNGKTRLKYNQSEGVVLDQGIGPVSHWKWHDLNDPPELQQVIVDSKFREKLGIDEIQEDEKPPQVDDETMVAIEYNNYIKSQSKAKTSGKFSPFQIRMKVLKINDQFSLRVIDQQSIYLLYREGSTTIKLNLGMILDSSEILDTAASEVGEVTLNIDKTPAATVSVENMQATLLNTKKVNRERNLRERFIKGPLPASNVDQLTAALPRPLQSIVPLPIPTNIISTSKTCKCDVPSVCEYYTHNKFY